MSLHLINKLQLDRPVNSTETVTWHLSPSNVWWDWARQQLNWWSPLDTAGAISDGTSTSPSFTVGICKATRAAPSGGRVTPWHQPPRHLGSTSAHGAAGTTYHQPEVLGRQLGSLAFQMSQTTFEDSYVRVFASAGVPFIYFQKTVQLNEHLQNVFWLWIHYSSVSSNMYSLCLVKITDSVVLPKRVYQNSGGCGLLVQMNRKMQTAFQAFRNIDSHCHFTEMPKPGERCQPGNYSAVSVPGSKTYYHFKSLCQAYSSSGE